MSSSKPPQQHRSTSSRPSRNTLYVEHVPTNRSRSSPNRQVIIILTNDHEILRHSRHLQPQTQQNQSLTPLQQNFMDERRRRNSDDRHREHILTNLLQTELKSATRDYLTRTRRPCPILHVFKLSDADTDV